MRTSSESKLSAERDSDSNCALSDVNPYPESIELNEMPASSKNIYFHRGSESEESEWELEEETSAVIKRDDQHIKLDKEGTQFYTADEERSVVKTFDRRLVIFIAFLYMLSFLDRSSTYFIPLGRWPQGLTNRLDIGNAKIAGLSHDLKLTYDQYEWLLRAFYITYILFEWMTLLYRVFPSHVYIAICVASWGFIASLQSVASSFTFMLILRALLGICEAAFGPGVPFFLSFFYRRDELALRTGLFISAAPLATSFASSLAWAITKVGTKFPIAPWRMVFLVEGFPSIIVAIFAWYNIPDSPETATYLSQRLRKVALSRLRKEKNIAEDKTELKGLKWREIWVALTDPKCYLTAVRWSLLTNSVRH